jgi:hypothetical protein
MRDAELIGVRPIAGHQEPPGKPRLDEMEAGASGHLRQLPQRYIEVAVQTPLKRRAMFELTGKCGRLHSPSRARALHHGMLRCDIYAQHQRDPQHALIAHEADFETGVAIHRSNQGDKAVRREEDVADAIVWRVKHFGKREINRLAACKQMFTILAGQGGKQKICSGGSRRF